MTRTPTQPPRLQVAVPVADLTDAPGGARQRQLLYGEQVELLEEWEGHFLCAALRDGYRGAVAKSDLTRLQAATHRVTALATHLYMSPDIKSRDTVSLSFGSMLTLTGEEKGFGWTHDGHFVPMAHLAAANRRFRDPAGVAEMFLGTPYLWGGNSRLGLDCSGLVQAACLACGLPCPGDSGDQARLAGSEAAGDDPLKRGDLIFWKGHVAMAVSAETLIHANAHHMSVVYEPAEDAVRRIARQGGGQVTGRRRLALA